MGGILPSRILSTPSIWHQIWGNATGFGASSLATWTILRSARQGRFLLPTWSDRPCLNLFSKAHRADLTHAAGEALLKLFKKLQTECFFVFFYRNFIEMFFVFFLSQDFFLMQIKNLNSCQARKETHETVLLWNCCWILCVNVLRKGHVDAKIETKHMKKIGQTLNFHELSTFSVCWSTGLAKTLWTKNPGARKVSKSAWVWSWIANKIWRYLRRP